MKKPGSLSRTRFFHRLKRLGVVPEGPGTHQRPDLPADQPYQMYLTEAP